MQYLRILSANRLEKVSSDRAVRSRYVNSLIRGREGRVLFQQC